MSLTGVLNTGRSTLLAHQLALQTASNNAANADTEGYARRDVQMRAVGPLSGVEVSSIRRRAESFLGGRILAELAERGSGQAQSSSLSALELRFTEGAGSLGERVDAFFESVRALATNPTDMQLRRDVLEHASSMTDTFNIIARDLTAERRMVDSALGPSVDSANSLAAEIGSLNQRILELETGSQEASDLRDRREVALASLADLVPISTFENDQGQVTVLLDGGLALVSGKEVSQLRAIQDAAYGGYQRIDLLTPGGLATDVTRSLRSGRIGGSLGLRDDVLPALADTLDRLAFDVATAVNGVHFAGYGLDGATGRNLLQPVALSGAASALRLETGLSDRPEWIAAASSAGAAVGGNDQLLALHGLGNALLAGGGTRTFRGEVAELVGTVGRLVQDNRESIDRATQQLDQLGSMRESQIGVSLDEEMIDITRFQRAYQAGARIIQTVDAMFESVLGM
jgi:flagellar hook-associated protein 1 FlgK